MPNTRKNAEGPVDRFVSINDAAKALGESRTRVMTRIAQGQLEVEVIAGRTFITRESVSRVKAQKDAAAAA
jgi:hypothetical protein